MQPLLKKKRLYWLCQAGGWGCFIIYEYVNYLTLGFLTPKLTIYFVFLSAGGLLLTHLTRYIFKKINLQSHALSVQAGVVLLSVILLGVTMYPLQYLLFRLFDMPWVRMTPTKAISFLLNNSLVFFGWMLTYSVYHLAGVVSQKNNEALQARYHLQEAELVALRSQLNPHFLFNTLNSIRFLVLTNPTRSRLAISQLSELMRYFLNHQKLQTITLREEVRITEKYLQLEEIRFGKRLQYQIDLPQHILDKEIPFMLLLSLVENAIKHGISKQPHEGRISIIYSEEENNKFLQVKNHGQYQLPARFTEGGIGLENIRRRLNVLWNQPNGFTIKNINAYEVMASIKLPA